MKELRTFNKLGKASHFKALLFVTLIASGIFLIAFNPLIASTGSKDYLIQPTLFTDDNSQWSTETQAYDWNNATSCTTTSSANDANDLDLHTWNTTDNQAEEITSVDIYIRADWSFTANDYITVKWYVWSTQGVGTFTMNAGNSGDDQIISFENIAEPIDATWSWTDITNIILEFDMERVSGNDLEYVNIDETWGWLEIVGAQPDEEDPVISVPDHDPDDPDENDNLRFDATITDNIDVTYAYTIWRIDEAGWTNSSMSEGASDEWFYLSGTHSIGDDIDYWFQARDLAYNWVTLDNTGSYYNVIITDNDPPDITIPDHDPDNPTETDYVIFDCNIVDNVDVTNAFAFYQINDAGFNNMTMTEGGGDEWSYTMISYFSIGDDIDYWFKARDAVSNWQILDNGASYYNFIVTDQDDPVISVPDHTPDTPKETDAITLDCTITDNDDVSNAYALWRIDGAGFTNSSMSEGASDNWFKDIGTHGIDELLEYYFQARDPTGNWVILDNTGSYYSVTITDQTNPVISNPEHDPSTPKETDSITLKATCTDNDDVTNAYVLWRIDGAGFTNSSMSEGGSNIWSFNIGTHSIDELIEYWFKCRDPTGLWQTLDNTGSYYSFYITDQDDPSISGEFYDPDPALYTDSVQINATVTDNDNVKNASVWWRVDAGSWSEALMSKDGDVYYYTIGSFSTGEYIEYFIEAYDDTENGVNGSTHGFYIEEEDPPEITGIDHLPDIPTELQTIQINATVTDAYLEDVILTYRVNEGDWTNATMSNIEGDIWSYTIGTFSIDDFIEYYIFANDTYNNQQSSSTFDFTVTDQEDPAITVPDHDPDTPKETDSITLRATCTDNDDVTNAYVLWRVDEGEWTNSSMSEGGSNIWSYDIGTHAIDELIEYWFKCRDPSYNWQTLDNTGSYYSVTVTDQDDPNLSSIEHLPAEPNELQTVEITCTSTDNDEVSFVTLYWKVDEGEYSSVNMTDEVGDTFSSTVGTFNVDETITYYLKSVDPSENFLQSSEYNFLIANSEGEEEELDEQNLGGNISQVYNVTQDIYVEQIFDTIGTAMLLGTVGGAIAIWYVKRKKKKKA